MPVLKKIRKRKLELNQRSELPHQQESKKINTWTQKRVDKHAREELRYQKAIKKLGEKSTEWRLQGGGKMLAVDAAGFMLVPSKHLRGATWRNLTPEGRVARTALLEHKQKEFTDKHGEEQGLKEYKKWLVKERFAFGTGVGLEATIWGLTVFGNPTAVGVRTAERAAERGVERAVERTLESALEKGAEHAFLDAGKHAAEEKLPVLVSSLKTKKVITRINERLGDNWITRLFSRKKKKKPFPA